MASWLAQMEKFRESPGSAPPIAQLIGFRLAEIAPGRAVFTLEAGDTHHNPMGTLHGGILCDLADAAMAVPTPPPSRTAKHLPSSNSRSTF